MRTAFDTMHLARTIAHSSVIALLIAGLMAGSVFAARGGNGGKPSGGGATLTLVMVADANGNGAPNYGDTITFTATTSASYPEVGLRCYQGANFVFDGYVSLYDSWLNKELKLESTKWDRSLDASCTARLFYYDSRSREKVLTSMSLVVAP